MSSSMKYLIIKTAYNARTINKYIPFDMNFTFYISFITTLHFTFYITKLYMFP